MGVKNKCMSSGSGSIRIKDFFFFFPSLKKVVHEHVKKKKKLFKQYQRVVKVGFLFTLSFLIFPLQLEMSLCPCNFLGI